MQNFLLILFIGWIQFVFTNFNHITCDFLPVPVCILARKISFNAFIRYFIFHRSLRNNRTRIHKNLFAAMIIQVIIRLTLYIDQAIIGAAGTVMDKANRHGIDNTVSDFTMIRLLKLYCYLTSILCQ